MVENLSNPGDVKTVKVYMEGVASQNTYFSIIAGEPLPAATTAADKEAAPAESTIELGDLYFGQHYTDRSFIINNFSDTPLEFSVLPLLCPAS